ncbi:MAG: SCO6745 family protein [Frankiaceae bacterium]
MSDRTPLPTARRLWARYEPLHAVTYFSPEARAAWEGAGVRGYWRGYFAGRTAPLGPVEAAPVTALFFGFAPAMVARALPDIWTRVSPQRALQVRVEGAVAALRRLLPADAPVAAAADALQRAVDGADLAGRALGAANAAVAAPADDLGRLWHAATVLREHRGDGHVAALVAAGLDGCESLVWRAALDLRREDLQPNRGWTDEEWAAARARLAERGWLAATGEPTDEGRRRFREVEAATDRAAGRAWRHLDAGGADGAQDVERLLGPLAAAAARALPASNPIGLPGLAGPAR